VVFAAAEPLRVLLKFQLPIVCAYTVIETESIKRRIKDLADTPFLKTCITKK